MWKPAFGFEGIYEVSDVGVVRRIVDSPTSRAGKILKPYIGNHGYPYYDLRKSNQYHRRLAHRLVLESFVGPSDLFCNHINGVRSDCRLENLEWNTPQQNLLHACRVLGKRRGSNHWKAILTEENVRKIRELSKSGMTHEEIASIFGMRRVGITNVISGKTWKHVSGLANAASPCTSGADTRG